MSCSSAPTCQPQTRPQNTNNNNDTRMCVCASLDCADNLIISHISLIDIRYAAKKYLKLSVHDDVRGNVQACRYYLLLFSFRPSRTNNICRVNILLNIRSLSRFPHHHIINATLTNNLFFCAVFRKKNPFRNEKNIYDACNS